MFGCQGYLLDNDCYASLAVVMTQIQCGSVSRSHQLFQCMGTGIEHIEAWMHIGRFKMQKTSTRQLTMNNPINQTKLSGAHGYPFIFFKETFYSLYIYRFSTLIDFSSEKYSGSTGDRTPGTSREIYSEDVDGETRTRNPWITNPVL